MFTKKTNVKITNAQLTPAVADCLKQEILLNINELLEMYALEESKIRIELILHPSENEKEHFKIEIIEAPSQDHQDNGTGEFAEALEGFTY